jgi:hypothetical protein
MSDKNEPEKTVADMTEAEQIERLARQRNRLFKLIFWFGCKYGTESREDVDLDEDTQFQLDDDGKLSITIDLKLPDGFKLGKLADELLDKAEKIVGHPYVTENYNCINRDANNEEETRPAFAPYFAALPKDEFPEDD